MVRLPTSALARAGRRIGVAALAVALHGVVLLAIAGHRVPATTGGVVVARPVFVAILPPAAPKPVVTPSRPALPPTAIRRPVRRSPTVSAGTIPPVIVPPAEQQPQGSASPAPTVDTVDRPDRDVVARRCAEATHQRILTQVPLRVRKRGTVSLTFTLDAAGIVTKAVIDPGSGDSALDHAARSALAAAAPFPPCDGVVYPLTFSQVFEFR